VITTEQALTVDVRDVQLFIMKPEHSGVILFLHGGGVWIGDLKKHKRLGQPPDNACTPSETMQHSAIRLSIALLRESRPDLAPARWHPGDIPTTCWRLDGVPLAIEQAAARAAVLGVTETAATLDCGFRMLTRGRRTAPPRPRTLQSQAALVTIDGGLERAKTDHDGWSAAELL
jgi:hypothetical protein